MAPRAAKPKARVRAAGGTRSAGAMRAVVWPPGCPWPGVWLWPGPFGAGGPMGPEGPGGPDGTGAPEWSPAEFRRALWIAIAITVAGLLLGTLIAAWAGGAIPGPDRLFGLVKRFVSPLGRPRAESPGELPEGRVGPGPLPERPSPGYPAPGIDCKTISGERLCLRDCAGDMVLLTFFSTASGASFAHVSVLAQMHAEGLEGTKIVAIAVAEKADAVLRYMEARKLALPVIADPGGELARLYEITAVPTTFVVDAQGIVRDLRVGAMTRAQLERAVRSAL
jgi:cytochrome c biogenesis protein CcmG/thiol:disulfide interchange protein DsbE